MDNLSSMYNMINTGQFGYTSPQPNGIYYNMGQQIMQPQINTQGYYGAAYQQQYQQPTAPMPQQYGYGAMPNNGFVFQPVNYGYGGGYNPQPQPQQTQTNYFDPYGAYGNQNNNQYYNNYRDPMYANAYGYPPQQGYTNGYYGGYNGYGYGYNPMQQKRQIDSYVKMMTLKHSIVDKFHGDQTDPHAIAKKYNPALNKPTIEQIQQTEETRFMNYVSQVFKQPRMYDQVLQERDRILAMSAANHREFDNHSLFEFLNDDMWKIERDIWIRENVVFNRSRNLSTMYDSNDYNELLNLHRSSNPYIGSLLNTSRYDNNLDDIEMGMRLALDKARRRMNVLEGKVPDYISSPEVQEARNKFLNVVLEKMYKKNGGGPGVKS